MLSIIISSYREKLFKSLSENIEQTIGVTEYEIVKIENSGAMGICKAYNKGAKLAKNKYLLFLHEDVDFLVKNWGKEITILLSQENTGVVGVAGSTKKFALPTGCEVGIREYRHVFVTHLKDEKPITPAHPEPIKVKTLDGVFLAMTKESWKEFKFNEDIPGFHFYDLDISLRISERYQNYVLPSIFLQHFSLGNFGNGWITRCIEFHKGNYNFDLCSNYEKEQVRTFWYSRLRSEKISFSNRLLYIKQMGFSLDSWRQALKFLYE